MQLPGNKMKFCLSGGLLALTTCAALGADPMMPNSGDLYRAGEMDFDAFGSASLGKYTLDHISNARIRHNIRFGAGLGLSYFLTRNIGISADAYSENTTGTFVDSASLNLTARFPLGESGFAPYVFGGGGHQFDLAKVWFGQVGAGVEYRFTPNIGVFVDARWVIPEETRYYGVGRLGMRFAF